MHHTAGLLVAVFLPYVLAACATQAVRESVAEQESSRQFDSETEASPQKSIDGPQHEQEPVHLAKRKLEEKTIRPEEASHTQEEMKHAYKAAESGGIAEPLESGPPQTGSDMDVAMLAPSVHKLFASLSLEEKIGQIFMVGLKPELWGAVITEMTPKLKEMIDAYKPGGVLLFAPNLKSIRQTIGFIEAMQRQSRIPIFIALDEEAGEYGRLGKSPAFHATLFPNNQTLGSIGTEEMLFEVGRITGVELSSLGFNMNMAPVADVNSAGENSYIGKRSLGSDPERVASLASAYVRGIQSSGVIAVMKHFPGHGSTQADTHKGTVVVGYGLDRLMDSDLKPFLKGIESGVGGIMTAHITVPAAYGEEVPATFSPALNRTLLREKLGYKNLIITDALDMKAVTVSYNQAEAAVKAFLAGADILLMPRSIQEAYEGIRRAVEQGIIPMERLDESVLRILTLKHASGFVLSAKSKSDPEAILGNPEHKAIAEKLK